MTPIKIEHQQVCFYSGITLGYSFRISQLKKLKTAIKGHEDEIVQALYEDLGKSEFESYATEIGIVYEEINLHMKKLRCWMKRKSVGTPLTAIPARSFIYAEPLGVCLIISTWNYPFQLAFAPLVAAISAGNCVTLKPSEYSKATTRVIEKIIGETFSPDYIQVVSGDAETARNLLKLEFDFIFFTGSTQVGRHVMLAAADRLIPVVLELGGKSPCIVEAGADIKQTAKRIIWGKLVNAGQTCIAPDYVLVHSSVSDLLVKYMIDFISEFYTSNPSQCRHFPKIINQTHFDRLKALLYGEKTLYACQHDEEDLKFGPTIVEVSRQDSPLMEEEIFGPILPVIKFDQFDEAINFVRSRPKPLAFYLFTNSSRSQHIVIDKISAGGITINDSLMHFTNPSLPFGGTGASGMGSYHGYHGFKAFTHFKPVMKRATWIDIPLLYPPFGNRIRLLRRILK
ncbi:MAG: aldehyde dehydrogenase [Bacteroidales bacterium]|nr:aldehyde dehydrogenase [Bacteroidales bacterium]